LVNKPLKKLKNVRSIRRVGKDSASSLLTRGVRRVVVKTPLLGVASVIALAVATPANAAVDICAGSGQQCAPQTDANILLTSGSNLTTVQGSFNGGGQTAVGTFTSSTDRLNADASGQAMISSATDASLNQLTFSLLGGATFTTATFDLFSAGTSGIAVTLNGLNAAGLPIVTEPFTLTNGTNFFGVVGTGGDRFTGLSFSAADGIVDFRQLRLGGVQTTMNAVPEPGTWAMMLLGFGGMGVAMRRRRGATTRLLQVA
jgi:hypothetical protein